MTIDSKNIDQWLFNYYEGNLSPAEVKQLESFLKRNPDYYEDANAWKDSFVEESVPAFNASFLVKEIDTKADRKRFAFATLALLLIGSFSALYLASNKNTNSEDKNNISASTKTARNNSSVMNNGSNGYSKSTSIKNSTNYSNHPTIQPRNNSVVNNKPQTINYKPLNTRPNNVITHVNTPHNTPVNNSVNTVILTNNVTNSNSNTYVAPTNLNQNNGIQLVTQNINTTIVTTNILTENNNAPSLIVEENIVANIPENNHANVIPFIEDFTPIQIEPSTELVNVKSEGIENINLTTLTSENYVNIPSDLNPDKLMAEKKADDPNNKGSELVSDKNRKDIELEKGLRFGNLRNVRLLQNINSEFQNNGSFITQHYANDGYLAANYNFLSNGESKQNFVAGYSRGFRKIRTTINGFINGSNTNSYAKMGTGIQAALNLKLDRHQYLVPSLSATFDQYTFTSTEKLGNASTIGSYHLTQLTGKSESIKFNNASQFNLNTGLLYHHKLYYLSLSFNGILQPKFKYEQNDRETTVTNYATVSFVAGTDFISKKRPEFSLSPQVIFEIRNLEPVVTGGSMVKFRGWRAGTGISSKGAINAFAGFNHRILGVEYRFIFDKVESTYGNLSGHYLTAHFNLKSLNKKQKAILDDER